MRTVQPERLTSRRVLASQEMPRGSRPVAGSSKRSTRGAMDEGASDGDALAHAAGEGADKGGAALVEADFAKQIIGAGGRLRDTLEFGEEDEVFFGGEFVVDHGGVGDVAGAAVRGGVRRRRPGRIIFQQSGRTMRAATRRRVVLPEPLRPAMATHSPGEISRETRRRAKRPPKRLSMLSKRRPVGGRV